MKEEATYCPDSSSLIDIDRHYHQELRRITKWAKQKLIKIPRGVQRELHSRSGDRLSNTVSGWIKKHDASVDLMRHQDARQLFGEIERKYGNGIRVGNQNYPGLFQSPRSKKSADAEVIAISKAFRYVVVSNDKAIQSACMLENVECITWQEFLRRVRGGQQMDFFIDDRIKPS